MSAAAIGTDEKSMDLDPERKDREFARRVGEHCEFVVTRAYVVIKHHTKDSKAADLGYGSEQKDLAGLRVLSVGYVSLLSFFLFPHHGMVFML